MINEEFIAYFVQKAAETIAPWLVVAVVVLLILWFVLLCRQTRPFAKPFSQFIRLPPFGKLVVIAAVCLCTLFGGSKEGGNCGGESGASGDRALSGESGGMRGLPPELAAESNLLSITAFEVDPIGGAVGFGIVCASNLFNYTASRDLYLFSSTNLSESRWMPLGAFPMPEGTNACAFTVTTNDVDLSARPFFLDSLDGIGFYRFGADFDSDGDGLIDIYEVLWTLTDPGNPDSDGDWMPDGDELALGTDPLSADTDLDGIPDYVETGGIAIDFHLQPFFEGAVLTNMTAAILADTTYNSYSTERKSGIAEIVRGDGWVADNADGLLSGHVHQRQGHGGNVAGHLTATLYVLDVDISICAPSGAAWEELDASRVLLDSEQLRMKAEIRPRMSSEAHCRRLMGDAFTVRTVGTCPDGAELTLDSNALFENLGDRSVLKVWRTRSQLKTLGLLPPNDDDGVDEMAWFDMGSADPTQPSNLTDSEAFSALGYEFRGKATQDETKTLDSTPPNAQPSESFFKAAGCEVVTAEYCGFTSPKRQIMNQADIFYYSGHGLFIDGSLQNSSNPTTYGFLPSMAIGKWSHGLKCAVFAGCSILNIGDFRSHSFLRWKTKTRYWFRKKQSYNDGSPGISWENVGPQYLLGYCWTTPLDSQGAPGIVTAFINNLKNGMSKIDA